MELRDYLRIFRKNWLLILACILIGIGASAGYSLISKPVYQAKTGLYVSVRTGEAADTGQLVQGTNFARQAVTSYVDVVTSTVVTDEVAKQLGLDVTGVELAKRISASSPQNTVLINIVVSDGDPTQAALIANTTAAVFSDVVVNQLEKPSPGSPARVQIDTIQPATVPAAPVSPKVPRNIALGFLLGVAAGVGAAVLRDVLNTRVRSKSDVAAITETPIVGGVIFDPESKTRPLIMRDSPQSPAAEAIRALRTNLQFLDLSSKNRSFVITSPNPQEGKTTTIANLAIALAETGSRVALIDADLRKPKIADYMGLEGAVGLTDVLIGQASLEDAMQQWGRSTLFILPAGRKPPNPSELLGSAQMESLLASLTNHFDFVLVDAPPVLAVTDAAVVSSLTGGLLLAVAANSTRKPELAGAIDALESSGTNLLGVVLTMVPTKGPDAFSYGAYSYGSNSPYIQDAEKPQPAGKKKKGRR